MLNKTGISFDKLVRSCTGLEVTPEYKFHPSRRWRFDYVILSHKIAIEVEGGAWIQGRHTRGSGFVKDMEKYNEATRLGYRLIRVQPEELYTDYTIKLIEDIISFTTLKPTAN
jgi:very-short-patch-repair endonuclease